jgi:hypothetical protein
MRRILVVLLALVAGVAASDDWVNNSITVSATSQTVTLTEYPSTVWIKNVGATNEIFVCPWRNDQTVADCTASIGRRLEPGEAKSWGLGARPNQYWVAVSLIASVGESSTARGDSLP